MYTIYNIQATVKRLMSVETIILNTISLCLALFASLIYINIFENVFASTDFETTAKWQAVVHLVLNHLIAIIRR